MLEIALFCLSLNVYHEARGEPIVGQYAVAMVTVNRANGNHKKVCGEVTRKSQFTWTEKLTEPARGGRRLLPAGVPKEHQAWRTAQIVAANVLLGKTPDFTKGATHYHTTEVKPAWRLKLKVATTIGNHIFYTGG